jgi:hypothetical protein
LIPAERRGRKPAPCAGQSAGHWFARSAFVRGANRPLSQNDRATQLDGHPRPPDRRHPDVPLGARSSTLPSAISSARSGASPTGTYLELGLGRLRRSRRRRRVSSRTRSLERCARCLRCRGHRHRVGRGCVAAQLRSDTTVLRSAGDDPRIGASNPGPAPRATPPRALVSARATRRALPNLVRLPRGCHRRRRPHPVVSPALGRSGSTVGLCYLAGKPRPLRGRRVAQWSVHRLAGGRARLCVRSVPPRPVSLDMTRHVAVLPSHARFSSRKRVTRSRLVEDMSTTQTALLLNTCRRRARDNGTSGMAATLLPEQAGVRSSVGRRAATRWCGRW